MSNITITVTEIVDGLSVESTPTSITVFDGVFVNTGGGGGGAVNSVNGHTGTVVLGAADVGAATAAQGALADTAVQPGDLGTAAALNVPATGNATTSQVVKGNDTRLTDARTPTTHTHAETDITGLTTDLSTKAPLVSPAFTGNPTAPTQTAGNNSTRVATTAFVTAAVAAGGGGGGTGTVDTVVAGTGITVNSTDPANPVVAASIGTASGTVAAGNDSRFTDARTPTAHASTHASAGSDPITIAESQVTNLTTDLAAKAPLASPAFTGNPTATTQTAGNNSTRVATTAYADNAVAKQAEVLMFALSDESTAITTGTKVTFRVPFAFTLTEIRASLTTASSSGNPAFDVKKNGTTVFSTALTIDSTEKTSKTAATAAVLSTTSLSDDDEIALSVTTAGTGAAGAKITLIGTRT